MAASGVGVQVGEAVHELEGGRGSARGVLDGGGVERLQSRWRGQVGGHLGEVRCRQVRRVLE